MIGFAARAGPAWGVTDVVIAAVGIVLAVGVGVLADLPLVPALPVGMLVLAGGVGVAAARPPLREVLVVAGMLVPGVVAAAVSRTALFGVCFFAFGAGLAVGTLLQAWRGDASEA